METITPAQLALAAKLADLGAHWDGDSLRIERAPGGDVIHFRFDDLVTFANPRTSAPTSGRPGSVHLYNPEHAMWRRDVEQRVQIEIDRLRHEGQAGA